MGWFWVTFQELCHFPIWIRLFAFCVLATFLKTIHQNIIGEQQVSQGSGIYREVLDSEGIGIRRKNAWDIYVKFEKLPSKWQIWPGQCILNSKLSLSKVLWRRGKFRVFLRTIWSSTSFAQGKSCFVGHWNLAGRRIWKLSRWKNERKVLRSMVRIGSMFR